MMLATSVKEVAKSLAGPIALGFIDYFRFPERRKSWGGPLNGQVGRRRIAEEVFKEFDFKAVVETGTYRGTSTRYFASFGVDRIYTIEANPRNYGFALANLSFVPGVKVLLGDSRLLLKNRVYAEVGSSELAFFYLDAHWDEDLPLKDELEIVFSRYVRSVVCVDDFRVNDDASYGYDDYGPGKTLEIDELRPIIQKYNLAVFFPVLRAKDETGAKRGCVFLAKDERIVDRLSSLQGIRHYCRGAQC